MRLLFAEDDRDISKAVKTLLERSGYSVDVVFNGQDAIDYIESGEYDGVILDWMMPKRSGIEVLTQMRAKGFSEPVLILTARDSVDDRVKGLDTGADDYLPKPFAASELLARIRAMLRRKEDYKHDVIKFSDIELDKSAMSVTCNGKSVRLNNKAFQLMEMLVEHPGAVLSIDQIMERIWGWDSRSKPFAASAIPWRKRDETDTTPLYSDCAACAVTRDAACRQCDQCGAHRQHCQ